MARDSMNVLVLDGHPDDDRLIGSLLDEYVRALPETAIVTRIYVRDLEFDPVLHKGFKEPQPLEPAVRDFAEALEAADHLVVGFPLWWGAEPALLKGLLDRALLPGFAFRYHPNDPMWDRLLAGRSADVIVTMDTPPWYLWLFYGDAFAVRWKRQVLGFVGFKPVRVYRFGMTRRGGAKANLEKWRGRLRRAAHEALSLRRGPKNRTRFDGRLIEVAIEARGS